jgi:tetratricopeptide (TPR) repeat protein
VNARKLAPLVVVAAGLLAYSNSFTGAFVDDDFRSIPENHSIQHLWPIWKCLSPPRVGGLTVEGRPLINLSLAVSYALSGYNVWGYHVINLVVHILAGLTLLGIVRRTLLQPAPIRSGPALRERFGAVANELALATAVLWTVHPLQTESVTYIIQRAESIMGLFYLLTLYCFIRGVDSSRPRLWYGLSVTACALGMASKEVMVSAPVMVLLYDRAFLSDSFRNAWQRRWRLYLGVAATWILLGVVLVAGQFSTGPMNPQQITQAMATTRGLRDIGVTWWGYLATEPGVILYYLRLCVWPAPLCLNHPWPIAGTWMSVRVLTPTGMVLILLAATVWAWRRNPVWGFVGAWFFLILAPSSSFIPLPDAIYEHRMYLSSAAVISVVVAGLYSLAGRKSLAVFLAAAVGLGFLTWRRNQDYRSEIAIRAAGVAAFPDEPETHFNMAVALERLGRVQEAIGQYDQALQLKPDYAWAHYNLGVTLARLGRVPEAVDHYEQALRTRPDYAWAHFSLGEALVRLGRVPEGIEQYQEALRISPENADAQNNLGAALAGAGRMPEAIEHFQQVVRLRPDDADAHNNLGAALAQVGHLPEAIDQFTLAVQLKPDDAETHANLGFALEQAGRVPEAIAQYKLAVRLEPDLNAVQQRLARLRAASPR